jgi:hypothetical protein
MALFTFVAEYKGGVAITQIHALSVGEASHQWAAGLRSHISEMSEEDHEEIMDHLEDDSSREDALTPIESCKGVWRMYLVDAHDETIATHIVRTSEL